MKNLLAFILGGGKGTRLYPLTQFRSKPAVPLAGKYRLIDIPISNCLNCGINRIYLLTQFNSVSLHRHIRQAYKFDHFGDGFVETLAAQQTMEGGDWYQGTADAVRKNLRYIEQYGVEHVLILSGDQLYRMDFPRMLREHKESAADVTIAGKVVSSEEAAAFGIMRIDESGRVVGFLEKPKTEDELKLIRTDPAWLDAYGIESRGRDCLASMGIYLFNRDTLVELLSGSDYQDFGKEVFPMAIRTRKVQIHPFDGYWEDIGTIRSFYEANLALARPNPPFSFMAQDEPIYTHPRFLPPTRIDGAGVKSSLIADGCIIGAGATVENSVIGVRCRIGRGATIRNSILMGVDYYAPDYDVRADRESGRPYVGVDEGTLIDGAIIDKNCAIGRNVRIEAGGRPLEDAEIGEEIVVRDGVIVVCRGATLPDGWTFPLKE